MVEAIAKGATLFVGAGSSCKIGYPGWGGLLKTLATAAKAIDPAVVDSAAGTDGLLQAGKYRQVLGDAAYFKLLQREFAPKTPPHHACHERLLRMPFRHVLTSNYDPTLQSAHKAVTGADAISLDGDEWTKLAEFLQGHSELGRHYVHIHGSVGRPEGIVLTGQDYKERYYKHTEAKAFLTAMLRGSRVVFVGFSLTDQDFGYILREVAAILDLSEPRHFAILPYPLTDDKTRIDFEKARIERANMQGMWRVEPVHFDNTAGDYSALWEMVEKLQRDVAEQQKSADPPAGSLSGPSVTVLMKEFVAALRGLDPVFEQRLSDPAVQRVISDRLLAALSIPPTAGVDPDAPDSPIDVEITNVFALVENGVPDAAIEAYERIRTERGSTLTVRQSYRIDANIGNALYSQAKFQAAGEAYIRATAQYRGSRDAGALEAFGYFLIGQHDRSRELAEELTKQESDFPRAWSLWLRAQPDTADFDAIESQVPVAVRSDAEVCLSLADFAGRCDKPEKHEEFARIAVSLKPDWSEPYLALGTVVVMRERESARVEVTGLIPPNPSRIEEAERYLSRAIELTVLTDPGGRLGLMHLNRSVARRLLGRDDGALEDLRTAYENAKSDPAIVLGYALAAESPADVERALEAVRAQRPGPEHTDQMQFALARLLYERDRPEVLGEAADILRGMCGRLDIVRPEALRIDVVNLMLRVFSVLGRSDEGEAAWHSVPSSVFPEETRELLSGKAAFYCGDRERAGTHAINAAKLVPPNDSSPFLRSDVAMLLQSSGLFRQALVAWQAVGTAGVGGIDSHNLVRCAYFANEKRLALDVCEAERAHGTYGRAHLEIETRMLGEIREGGRAIEILQQWIAKHPDDTQAVLNLSLMALADGHREAAVFDEQRLPKVSAITTANAGAFLVYVLRRGPVPQRSLEVAYELYRRFPDDAVAHQTLMACIFDPSATPLQIERPSLVGDNTAALISRANESPRWIYVEDAPSPVEARGEKPRSSELVQAMWGKRSGDTFEFSSHSYRVAAIENKALRRAHEIMERFEENFPDHPVLRRMSIPANPPENATLRERLGEEMYQQLEELEEHSTWVETLYREHRIAIASFAVLRGRPVFDVVRYLASDPALGVLAADGNPAVWIEAVKLARDAKSVVIDGTVLASSLMLEIVEELPNLGLKLLVPRSVVDEIRQLSLDAASPRTGGSMGLHQGRLIMHQPSPEEIAAEVERLERILKFVNDPVHCEIVSGEATLDLPPDTRTHFQNNVGIAATDAAAVARKRSVPLWTDDLGLRVILHEQNMGVRCVWTQAVLRGALAGRRLRRRQYIRALGLMLLRGYSGVGMSSLDVAEVLVSVKFEVNVGAGAAAVRFVHNSVHVHPDNPDAVASVLRILWAVGQRDARAKSCILALVDGVEYGGRRQGFAELLYRGKSVPVMADPASKPLKRFLRSWRSRDGVFTPKRLHPFR